MIRPSSKNSHLLIGLALALAIGATFPQPVNAQIDFLTGKPLLGGGAAFDADDKHVQVAAEFTASEGDKPGQLRITATIDPGWHIYSLTQKPGGPLASKITLIENKNYRLLEGFRPLAAPLTHNDSTFPGLPIEEHVDDVTWVAPISLASGVDLADLTIHGNINMQVCSETNCTQTEFPFSAKLAKPVEVATRGLGVVGEKKADASIGEYHATDTHTVIRGHIEPAVAMRGSIAKLVLTAEPEPGWHVYALADRDPQEGSKPTLIVVSEGAGLHVDSLVADAKPFEPPASKSGDHVTPYYAQPVTWTVNLEIPRDARGGEYAIAGIIGYQTCHENRCDLPTAARFEVKLPVAAAGHDGKIPLSFAPAKYGEAARLAAMHSKVEQELRMIEDSSQADSLATVIALSLLGGLILNLMPCVLPVIGLKILSFVEQGGQQRRRVVLLNLWYSAGMIAVFLVLASLAVSLNLGWGEQFSSTAFNVVMASVVFVMALSFLGVWEIPIPGFVGSGKATKVAAREGAIGAFSKGVLTTILATPCSGPFLGSVFGFTLKQPPHIIYLVFGCIGLGMASPYLLIGAFPQLIRFLPKPGAWMDTFKQIMGFVMLGTVVFVFSFMDKTYVVPTFALLIGLWAACWWIGRTPLTAELGPKTKAYLQSAAFAAVIGWMSFTWLVPGVDLLPWQPFSRPALAKLTSEGKTVMVDFTAEWCPTCQVNSKFAINTEDVRRTLEEGDVVPLLADWTDGSQEIKEVLRSLGSKSIPLLAIFPADRPQEPIVLRDLVSKSQVIKALKEAGPSRNKSTTIASAQK